MEFIKENTTVDKVTGCWNWNKSCNSAGYGQFTRNGKYWTTHKFVFTTVYGPVPIGKVVRHSCHNTRCCNPEHLSIGTDRDNYHDSKEVHRYAAMKRRTSWVIDGWIYDTIRDAALFTGLSQGMIIKHSIDGIFDIDSYRVACKKANKKPKI